MMNLGPGRKAWDKAKDQCEASPLRDQRGCISIPYRIPSDGRRDNEHQQVTNDPDRSWPEFSNSEPIRASFVFKSRNIEKKSIDLRTGRQVSHSARRPSAGSVGDDYPEPLPVIIQILLNSNHQGGKPDSN